MSFKTALSGLNAATADLGVISHNIANVNTTGFKLSRTEFADMVGQSAGKRTIGSGVQVAAVTQQFKSGTVNSSSNPLDMAIDGNGFFRVSETSGETSYTRAGGFGVDKNGYVVNALGQKLQGFPLDAGGSVIKTVADLQVPVGAIDPKVTSRAEFGVNLDANGIAPTAPFDPSDSKTYNYTTALTVYDSVGNPHSLSLFFVKGAAAGAWSVESTIDGKSAGTFAGADANALAFDSKGKLSAPADGKLDLGIDLTAVYAPNPNPANTPLDITIDVTQFTQFGGKYSTNSLAQDGYASGALGSLSVGEDGTLFGRYTNGESKPLGQVALFNFRNVQGLAPIGDTAWAETSESGPPVFGAPASGQLGSIRGSSLEGSNVELSEQLVGMIGAQRMYQANAQVIGASDQLMQSLLQQMR